MCTKICSKCKIEKDLDKFAKSKTTKDGRYSSCRECKNSWKRNIYWQREEAKNKSFINRTDLFNRFKYGQRKANERSLEWSIDFDSYKNLIKECFYCNSSLCQETGHNLDRKNNSYGYTLENVVPCCGKCNISRADNFSHEEWIEAIKAVMNHRRLAQQ